MTTDEAIALIEAAGDPRALFGSDSSRAYRRLARLTHPDNNPGDHRASSAFAKLAALWQRHTCEPGQCAARGDMANFYLTRRGLRKLARDPADNDLMNREAEALTRLRRGGDKRYLAYVPHLVETERHQDPRSGVKRRANVIGRLDGFYNLAEVHAAFPDGVDPKGAAWMWRRLLVAVGFAHRAGLIHAAVLPEHVMIHPADHGLVLVDWCYTVSEHACPIPAVPGRYRAWYPPEVLTRQVAGPDLDIYLATRCMTYLIGNKTPAPLASFAAGCVLRNPRWRPKDAWQLLSELDELLERLYGPRKFRAFAMPA